MQCAIKLILLFLIFCGNVSQFRSGFLERDHLKKIKENQIVIKHKNICNTCFLNCIYTHCYKFARSRIRSLEVNLLRKEVIAVKTELSGLKMEIRALKQAQTSGDFFVQFSAKVFISISPVICLKLFSGYYVDQLFDIQSITVSSLCTLDCFQLWIHYDTFN